MDSGNGVTVTERGDRSSTTTIWRCFGDLLI